MSNNKTFDELIDFSGQKTTQNKKILTQISKSLADKQKEGAIALYNILKREGVAYLADEVGMGKTYIALGVISLMRYFNPGLTVLYILPNQNVYDKWKDKEYINFLKHNFKQSHCRVRNLNNQPAVPQANCHNLIELIKKATTGYYGDYFIKMTSFSFPLKAEEETIIKKIRDLEQLVPSFSYQRENLHRDNVKWEEEKRELKKEYAKTINRILPDFDLIVIDEAHNFRKNMDSSARNKYMSIILGTYDGNEIETNGLIKKVNKALLLSATPYDRNINQLANQLRIVGKNNVAKKLKDNKDSSEDISNILKNYFVRRLNTINIKLKGKGEASEYTRNMYRIEKRKEAAIKFNDKNIESQLITALIQKKVGERISDRKDKELKDQYETGLLASFESYLPKTDRFKQEYDSDSDDNSPKKAIDNEIIKELHNSYTDEFYKRSIPHPKMDTIVSEYSEKIFNQGIGKHLIFVRRVQSVPDLKTKFDTKYNEWLIEYLNNNIKSKNDFKQIKDIFNQYNRKVKGEKSIVGKSNDSSESNKYNNFFNYFFSGKLDKSLDTTKFNVSIKPLNLKNYFISKQTSSELITTFQVNWYHLYNAYTDQIDISKIKDSANRYLKNLSKNNNRYLYYRFTAVQAAYLKYISNEGIVKKWYDDLNFSKHKNYKSENILSDEEVTDLLNRKTFFSSFSEKIDGEYKKLLIDFENINNNHNEITDKIYEFKFFTFLISFLLRNDHGIIDVYIAYLNSSNSSKMFLEELFEIIDENKGKFFSTYNIIKNIINNYPLIIRSNFSEYDKKIENLPKYISNSLAPLEPVLGVHGGVNRTPASRRFRMPGYPLIVISTNVLQEGEDLHLFCNEVTHYGISASPLAIEQKNGRVDRVNSLTRRRIKRPNQYKNKNSIKKHFIKVNFPYIEDSIEYLQIARIAKALNEFIKDLHEGISVQDKKQKNNSVEEIKNRPKIPEAITDNLSSKFKINDCYKKFDENGYLIKTREKENTRVKEHIKKLLPKGYSFEKNVKFARSPSKLILKIKHDNNKIVNIDNSSEFYDIMQELSVDRLHRTNLDRWENSKYTLSFDCQMLIGDQNITQQEEVIELIKRSKGKRIDSEKMQLVNWEKLIDRNWLKHQDFIRTNDIALDYNDNNHTSFKKITFKFPYNSKQNNCCVPRKQKVYIESKGGYLIFTSNAHKIFDGDLNYKDLIKYTWERNINIDIVEFIIEKNMLKGRIVHPVKNIQMEEFMYCAYTLACETDRLELIISKEDKY